jgi:hypothetical protein
MGYASLHLSYDCCKVLIVMKIPQTQRKLRETIFFLEHLLRLSGKAVGDREHFHFYLSAFLGAARSVGYVLESELGDDYTVWFEKWKICQTKEDLEFIIALWGERHKEVHKTGADQLVREEAVHVYDVYKDESGSVEVFGPPAKYMKDSPATVYKPKRFFQLCGQPKEVTAACMSYVNICEKIVRDFCETQKDE